MILRGRKEGFTIVELLIATSVFAVLLLLCSVALIQISRVYYKGVTTTRTQEASRNIIDDISRGIQFSGGTVTDPLPDVSQPGVSYFCVNNARYTYKLDTQVTDNSPQGGLQQGYHALVKDTTNSCGVSPPNLNTAVLGAGAVELLPQRMRLATLSLQRLPNNLFKITVRVVSGDSDLLNAAHNSCGSFRAGTQFCAYSELSTTVQKRL